MTLPPEGPAGAELLSREGVHDGFFAFEILELRHERFAGGWSRPLRRELLRQREAVAVLPFDPRSRRVVLVEQFRTGPFAAGTAPWLVEAPAGIVEPGETPEGVARRELREECGLEAGRLARAPGFWSSPGASTELVHAFVAEVELPTGGGALAAGAVFGLADEGEDIRAHAMGVEQAWAWLDAGRVAGVSGVVTLQWLRLHGERLARDWIG